MILSMIGLHISQSDKSGSMTRRLHVLSDGILPALPYMYSFNLSKNNSHVIFLLFKVFKYNLMRPYNSEIEQKPTKIA